MTNSVFRSHFLKYVKGALQDFYTASTIEHDYLKGRIREIAVQNILLPFLPASFGVGSGKIVDSENNQSSECDVIIYDREILPPVLFDSSLGLYPIESTLAVLEIKSKVNATEIKDAINKSKKLRKLVGIPDERKFGLNMLAPLFGVFAFSTDLSQNGESESDRYKKYDNSNTPGVKAICVINRGYWCYLSDKSDWMYRTPTKEFDEIADFISGLLNTLRTVRKSRGYPKIGPYLMDSKREWE